MNKKIMSFVLAMVLSVGLGLSAFASTNESSSEGTNSGVMREAGQTITAASALVDRITNVFHYEHGMITHISGADGSITLYDRGQYRMSLTLGLNGEYSVSNIAIYDTDLAEIEAAGGLDNWLMKWGVTEEQLQGGGSPAQWVDITSEEYEDHKNDKDENGKPLYKKETDDEGNTTYKKYDNGKPGEHVKWTDTAMNHLKGGINRSISINFNATDGASLTLNTNSKAYQTYAWDGELISRNQYIKRNGENGVITWQAEMDLVQKDGKAVSTEDIKDYAENKDNYKKAWSKTTTLGGKVISCVNDANPTQELRKYVYNDAGALKQVRDYVNGTITVITPNGSTTLSALSEDMDLSKMTDAEIDALISDATLAAGKNANVDRSTGFYISQSVVNNINGTTNYSISRDDSGKTTTVAYIANKQVASGNGVLSADYLRAQANAQYNFVLNGGKAPDIGTDVITVYWYADQLKEIAGDPAKLDRFVTSMGWDVTDKNRSDALEMINDALNFSSGNGSPALALSYDDTTYKQSDIDSLEKENKTKVSNIPSERFVSSATVYHHNAQSYTLNFADKDPSLARVAYISASNIFNSSILSEFGLTETSTITEYEEAIDAIISKLEEEFNKIPADMNADKAVKDLAQKYFKDPSKMELVINVEDRSIGTEHDNNSKTEIKGGKFDAYEEKTGKTKYKGYTTDAIAPALKALLKDVKEYLNSFVSTVESGDVVSVQDYINQTNKQECTVYHDYVELTKTVKDPAVVGTATYDPKAGTLTYGEGTRVYLQDGSGESYVLGPGETLVVDVSGLTDEAKQKIETACENGEEVMTMGAATGYEEGKDGKVTLTMTAIDSAKFGGGSATGDRLAEVEKALKAGGGDIVKDANGNDLDWIAQNIAENQQTFKDAGLKTTENGALEDWKAGWRALF